jgi:hypothetical protein
MLSRAAGPTKEVIVGEPSSLLNDARGLPIVISALIELIAWTALIGALTLCLRERSTFRAPGCSSH